MRTLYVTDLDGTLLNSQSRLSEYTLKTVNAVVERGVLFTYATARSLVSASMVTKGLSQKIPIIAYNGAFIIEPCTGEFLSHESFSCEETETVIDTLEKLDIHPAVYSLIDGTEKVSWERGTETEGMAHYLSKRRGDRRLRPLDTNEWLYDGEVFYFTCIGEKEILRTAQDILSGDERYTCIFQQELNRPEYWFEIMPRRATKANAIEKLKNIWQCDRVVSFGDALNDIPMFSFSDECYAVGNAVDELKAIATDIIGSNDDDGVAKWLEKNVF